MKAGIVGCGNICGIYFKNLCTVFDNVEVVACADLDPKRAKAMAAEYKGVRAVSVDELMADPQIEIVVNLTIPQAHYEVAMRAVESGKSVYSEKPITLTREEGKKLLAAAKAKGVRVSNAPDTFLGGGHQTCRKLIDDGVIGKPVAATAFMMCHGHESWHPDPEFYYKKGGGPMFDMGPYYLTALVNMLGPVKRVTGSARMTFPTRTITSAKKCGQVVEVEIPTHVAGVLDFAAGAVGTIITSFDVWSHQMPCIEVYGTEGSMVVPDPNGFGGEIRFRRHDDQSWFRVQLGHGATVKVARAEGKGWTQAALTHGYAENSRGYGVSDMAAGIKAGTPHRASGELAYHVLDVMHAFHDASAQGRHVMVESTCERPAALPATA